MYLVHPHTRSCRRRNRYISCTKKTIGMILILLSTFLIIPPPPPPFIPTKLHQLHLNRGYVPITSIFHPLTFLIAS